MDTITKQGMIAILNGLRLKTSKVKYALSDEKFTEKVDRALEDAINGGDFRKIAMTLSKFAPSKKHFGRCS